MSQFFSPVDLSSLILGPLRYFFSTYTDPSHFHWDPDEKKRSVELDYSNNMHKIPFNERPRILVDRGSYSVNKFSLTDNMSSGKTMSETFGLKDIKNFVIYSGQASIIIEAAQQGSCEILTDMVQHFLLWSRPYLCETQGFKDFASPLSVSSCEYDGSETNGKFRVSISVPYMKEEEWQVKNDSIKIKSFVINMQADGVNLS
jgi:hypothetical protein